MLNSKLTLLLILCLPLTGYCQWEEKSISTNAVLSCVDFLDDEVGFVTGGSMIFKTENGGNSWSTSHSDDNLVSYEDVFALDNDIIIAVGKDFDTNQSVITKTENGGANWTNVSITSTALLKSVFFVSASVGYCSGGDGTILKSTDSGNSWQALNSGTETNLQSIYFVNEMVGLAVGGNIINAIILKTEDGGANWNQINSPSSNNLQSVFFSSSETAYVVGWNGEIIKTEDCGESWTSQTSVDMSGNLEVVFTDDNTGYIVGGSVDESLVQKTTNGGAIWEDISPPIAEGLTSIHFSSFHTGYAVGGNGTVIKTESGGVITSIKAPELRDDFKIFPNPTVHSLTIESKEKHFIRTVKIYDANGQVLKAWSPYSTQSVLNLSDLAPNIYYLEIHSESSKGIKKIIKR